MKHHIKWAAIITGSLIVLFVVFLVLLRINFLIGEEIRVTFDKEYSSVSVSSPSTITFNTKINLYNKFVCTANCDYELIDLSHDEILDAGTFNSKTYKSKEYSKDIVLTDLGYGQNIYLFRLECKNIATTLCPSTESEIVRKSILVANFSPNIDEINSKEYLELEHSKFIKYRDSSLENLMFAKKILEHSKFDNSKFELLKSEFSTTEKDFDKILTYWNNDEYSKAKEYYVSSDLYGKIVSLNESSAKYVSELYDTTLKYNNKMSDLKKLSLRIDLLGNLTSYELFKQHSQDAISYSKELSDISSKFNSLDNTLISSDYSSIQILENNVFMTENSMLYSKGKIKEDKDSSNAGSKSYLDFYSSLYVVSSMDCFVNNNCNNSISKNSYAEMLSIPKDVSSLNVKISSMCNFSKDFSSKNSFIVADNDSSESLILQYKILDEYLLKINSIESSDSKKEFEASKESIRLKISSDKNILSLKLFESYAIDIDTLDLATYSINTSEVVLGNLGLMNQVLEFNNLCNNSNSFEQYVSFNDPNFLNLTYLQIVSFDRTDVNNNSLREKITLMTLSMPSTKTKCCMYDDCLCNKNDDSNYPVILLHGHSFNENTNVYNSIEIFNDFESQLVSSKEYYSYGTLINYDESIVQIQNSKRMIIKPTYYIQTYNDLLGVQTSESKTDSIDTYALRLKDIIDNAKRITGKDKVDIVAHSMGGLVTRRYIQIFGDSSINKFVMIGTPNLGISGKTSDLCSLFGAKNECSDMQKNGLFMKKLNDATSNGLTKDLSNTYIVAGIGCDTNGVNGDGVVPLNDSLMLIPKSNILTLNGTCTNTKFMHNDLLDPKIYPKAYDFVQEVLDR